MVEQKLVSVIIPVFNGAAYLAEALDSVFAQDYRPLEVIVVDDGSTDDTPAVAQSYSQVCYLHQANKGLPGARNTGLSRCTGDLITFLDSDDFWVPGKLAMQVAYLDRNPGEGCVIGRMKNFLQEGAVWPSWANESTLTGGPVVYALGTFMCRRSVVETVGYFNVAYLHSDDLEWLTRLKESGISIGRLEEVLLMRRIHQTNLSHRLEAGETKTRDRLRFLKESIDRKRHAQSLGKAN